MTELRFYCYAEGDERLPLCSLGLDPRVIDLFVRNGIIEVEEEMIGAGELLRIRKILRLRSFFGVNLNGAAIIVDLLERMEKMQREIDQLREGR